MPNPQNPLCSDWVVRLFFEEIYIRKDKILSWFLGLWESLHNPGFKPVEFDGFRIEVGLYAFTMSPTKWIESVNAKGFLPQRNDVETVVLLGNKFSKAKDYIEIGIDAEDYYRIKDVKSNE